MIEPVDEDPNALYEAFKELINSIRMSQGKEALEDSESECSTCPGVYDDSDVPEGNEDQQDEDTEGYDTADEGAHGGAGGERVGD